MSALGTSVSLDPSHVFRMLFLIFQLVVEDLGYPLSQLL